MTRKIRRTREYDFQLEIKDENFIRPPLESQRNWLLNRTVSELASDLQALDQLAPRFVPGIGSYVSEDRTQATLADEEIMEDWQIPLMKAMAALITENGGDVLEIGFGRGISADFIQQGQPRSHTIVECNDSVVQSFSVWRQEYPESTIELIHGRWQDVTDQLGMYDGIFFHTYPLTEEEYVDQVIKSTTFAEHFFPMAAAHLRDGGSFTYLANEIDSLSRAHQRLLFTYFRSFSLEIVNFQLPRDVRDAWWIDQMIVIKAVK